MPAETLQGLESHLARIEELGDVVSTMKSLAAVNIQHFEHAATAAERYYDNVRRALHILMINKPDNIHFRRTDSSYSTVIAIGSDQGMVGQFNDVVADETSRGLEELGRNNFQSHLISLGSRVVSSLLNLNLDLDEEIEMVGSLNDAVEVVRDILDYVTENGLSNSPLWVIHNRPEGGSAYTTVRRRILPLDRELLESLQSQRWDGRSIPLIRYSWDTLFRELSREYLFVALYAAIVESLASENAARLAAMQAAENNIDEKEDHVQSLYNQQRQSSITSELLDIVSGFEALQNN